MTEPTKDREQEIIEVLASWLHDDSGRKHNFSGPHCQAHCFIGARELYKVIAPELRKEMEQQSVLVVEECINTICKHCRMGFSPIEYPDGKFKGLWGHRVHGHDSECPAFHLTRLHPNHAAILAEIERKARLDEVDLLRSTPARHHKAHWLHRYIEVRYEALQPKEKGEGR